MSQILNAQVDEKPDKSELTASLGLNRPLVTGPPHDKKPWLSPPMVPTPLLPLPTLSFTVSQVIAAAKVTQMSVHPFIRPFICHKAKPFNSLKSSSFIILHSYFIILHSYFIILHSSFIILHSSFLHFATFKLFSLFF